MAAIPYANDPYLALVGRLAYAVAYLEWAVLGDIDRVPGVPAGLSVADLAGKTTGQISRLINDTLPSVSDPKTQVWLTKSAEVLESAAEIRNHVLHACPGTASDGSQMLYRWLPSTAFWITEDDPEVAIRNVEDSLTDLNTLRLPLPT